MCELCFRLILASHTDPVTGAFTGLDLGDLQSRPLLPEREPESVTVSSDTPNTSPHEHKPGTAPPD